MFPESLALTNYPKQSQQTFDVKFQPPQAITIETLRPREICPRSANPVSHNNRSQQPPKTEFERKMFAMKLLAQKKIRELSRPDDQNTAVERILGENKNLNFKKGPKYENENVESSLKTQNQTETKVEKTKVTENVRLKKILESQLSELESILDTKKGRKQNIAKKSTQIEDKELATKINKILISLLREISSLERQTMHFEFGSKQSDVAQKLLSTYQFSMSFIQTYHNEYSSKISESSQANFKEKLAKLTKSLTNCASQLSEFPKFDFPMPDLPPKPIPRNPPIPQKKNKTSNPKKAAMLQKRLSKNPKITKPFENVIPDQNRFFVRRTNYKSNSEDIPPNFSSDESIISFLASKPGHSRLSSPSNNRAQLQVIPSLLFSKHQSISSAKPSHIAGSDLHGVINDLSQEMIEELIDEQISDVLNSIDLSQIVSESANMPHFKPLPEVIEDLDYFLSAINSYESLLSTVENNLKLSEESVEIRESEKPKISQNAPEEIGMIIIPKPEHFLKENKDKEVNIESSFSKKVEQKHPIDPVFLQNLSDDRYKMMRYNRLHQPSIRLALKHNLLERMKDEILNSTMDNVAQQIFKTLDNYVEKNFFDEFLKTPETVNFVRNILRKTEDTNPSVPVTKSTLGVQTEQRSKNVQIQSILASPTPSNSPSTQAYSSDFSSYSLRTERSLSDNGVLSGNSEISVQISEHSIEIPSQLISFSESSQPVLRKGNEMVYGVSITEQISEISIDIPTLSHESPLPASSPDSLTPIGSSIFISRAVAELKTLSEAQLSLARSDSNQDSEPAATPPGGSASSSEPNLSELAYSTVLKRRTDIVCLDIESILPLPSTSEHELSTLPTPTDTQDYSDTFTQSNSTLYSLSQTQGREIIGPPPPPLTPIFQDSLDSSRVLTHSASSRSASAVTESIDEEISDF